jgi:hypothetical protein
LFENIAVIIDQHQPLVEIHYGKGKMLRVIQRLQEESDVQSVTILDRFLQTRKLESKVYKTYVSTWYSLLILIFLIYSWLKYNAYLLQ